MNDWFEWNGVKCTEYGIHVLEQPPITRPAERITFTDVPGKSGSLTTLQGDDVYDDLTLTATCIISDSSCISEICGWLKGGGTVTFANRPGGFYYARIVNQIPFEKILRGNPHRSFAVNFRCKPFWYQENCETISFDPSNTTTGIITNPGTVSSEPVMTLNGTGEITLMIGSNIIELNDLDGEIIIDSQLQEAYSGETSLNHLMSGDFPVLHPGHNAISWTGNVNTISIHPHWRWLL